MVIQFTIPGRVAGKARIRSRGTQFFMDAKTRAHESNVGWCAKQAMGSQLPFEGPVAVTIYSWRSKPISWSKKKQAAAIFATGKPDCDNLCKLILDALNGICYRDDSQISDLSICRRYSVYGDEQVNVTIRAADGLPSP